MAPKGILCVDDEALLVMSLKLELARMLGDDVVIETAMHPEDALEAAKALVSDGTGLALLITDWVMPRVGGAGLIRAVREIVPGLPVIVMTGHADEAEILAAVEGEGLTRIVPKPWQARTLSAAIHELASF